MIRNTFDFGRLSFLVGGILFNKSAKIQSVKNQPYRFKMSASNRVKRAAKFPLITAMILAASGITQGGTALGGAGDLDVSFGVDGKVTTDIDGSAGNASGVALQADGKIVTAARGTGDFTVVRYNQDGTLDTSFGNGGIASADLGSPFDETFDVAIQSDGKIVAVGATGSIDFGLARFNTDGSLDTTFDGDGKVTTVFGSLDEAFAVAIQPDGKIVAVGHTDNPSTGTGDFAVARYNSNGSLDTTFGNGGKVTTDFGGEDRGDGVLIQADGKIVVAGGTGVNSSTGSLSDFALARYNVDGTLDLSFGSAGKVFTDFGLNPFNTNDRALDVALQEDGKIIAVGVGTSRIALARYNTDGTLDPNFDSDGKVITEFFGESVETAYGVAIQDNSKIVIAGEVFSSFDSSFAIARYNTNGSLDSTFGIDGKVTTDFGDPAEVGVLCPPARKDCSEDRPSDIAIQTDGKIVAVGSAGPGTPPPFQAVARYLGDLPDLLNDKFAPLGPGDVTTAFSRTPCGGASAGTYTITATFTNISSDILSNLLISVNTLTGGNVLCNADGGPGGTGAPLTVPLQGDLADGQLSPSEAFTVQLAIGLQSFNRFQFLVDVLGEDD